MPDRNPKGAAEARVLKAEKSKAASQASLQLDRLIHERVRLGILSALAVNDTLSFNDLKRLMKATDGNLSVHARKLEEAQYVACTKSFDNRTPRTQYRLTATGRRAHQRDGAPSEDARDVGGRAREPVDRVLEDARHRVVVLGRDQEESVRARDAILERAHRFGGAVLGLEVPVVERHGEVAQIDPRDRRARRARSRGRDREKPFVERGAALPDTEDGLLKRLRTCPYDALSTSTTSFQVHIGTS